MSAEANKAVVLGVIEAANRQDAIAAAGFYARDVCNHNRQVGREGMRQILQSLFAAFPDWHFEVEEMLAIGDDVVVLETMTGTHLGTPALPVLWGALVGVPATGKRVEVYQMHRFRVVNGEVVDHRAVRDDFGMMQQLGLVPDLKPAEEDISRPPLAER
jgi:predicted ester cyclase